MVGTAGAVVIAGAHRAGRPGRGRRHHGAGTTPEDGIVGHHGHHRARHPIPPLIAAVAEAVDDGPYHQHADDQQGHLEEGHVAGRLGLVVLCPLLGGGIAGGIAADAQILFQLPALLPLAANYRNGSATHKLFCLPF